MPDTITIYKQTGKDAYGKRAYTGTPKTYRARVQYSDEVQVNNNGSETALDVKPTGKINVYGVADVSANDRVLLPGNVEVVVKFVGSVSDPDGAHHSTIAF
jgi:hypothetical protein